MTDCTARGKPPSTAGNGTGPNLTCQSPESAQMKIALYVVVMTALSPSYCDIRLIRRLYE
ncbi:hypothetical protein DY245_42070 [Streptomyces inhibens]|uniref:Uncharacterized protein n=1 Tax=Streptomyces inhibens TaxID=2293571 RepID=A0A371PQ86_STRIH|nr:hypothetical protein [Streptomyces inhibens]REK84652.1 hypothetical protein DY245_42070 [Streptomyces inhibens]